MLRVLQVEKESVMVLGLRLRFLELGLSRVEVARVSRACTK